MKPVVVFAIAFVVATAASTAAKVLTAKPAPTTHADSARADSTHADSTRTPGDSTRTDTAVVASGQTLTPPADSARAAKPAAIAPVALSDSGKAKPAPVQTLASAAAPAGPPAPDTVAQASERRIAKVFTSMDAKQAAKVLEHMADNDVQIILGYVGVKQAASIMAALPPERVANLSKLAMQGHK